MTSPFPKSPGSITTCFGSAENYPTTETQGATGTSPEHEAVHVHEESHASSATPGSGTELEEE